MAKMSLIDLQPMLAAAKADALAAMSSADLSQERADAMDYYLGDMSKDMPAQEGRSKAVSTDVADTIEGMLPQLLDTVIGTNEVVRMEPVGPEDEDAAQQESDYVNHVLMQLNNGWRVIYEFGKDGLVSKVGVVKVWWEEREQEEQEHYFGISEEQFAALAMAVEMSDGAMTITEHSVNNEGEDAPIAPDAEQAAY